MVLYFDGQEISALDALQDGVLQLRAQTFLQQPVDEDGDNLIEIMQGECATFDAEMAKPRVIGTAEVSDCLPALPSP